MLSKQYSSNLEFQDIQGLTDLWIPGVDVPASSLFWVRGWAIPGATDKKYLISFSTDHDSGAGGIHIGKADNLNLTDFEYIQLLVSGHQAETAWFRYVEGETEPVYMFYHTTSTDPANGGIQSTRLRTYPLGDFSTYTQKNNPLGSQAGDQHIGYLRFWDFPSGVIGVHLKGLVPSTDNLITYQYSTPDDSSLLTWTRGDTFKGTDNISPNRAYQLNAGHFFERYGRRWWMGTTRSIIPPLGYGFNKKQLVLALCDDLGRITKEVAVLNNGDYLNNWEPNEDVDDPNTMHLFMTDRTNPLKYATYDLRQLKHYKNL